MSTPVVIVPRGGTPITPVDSGAPVVTAVVSGGAPVTITDNASPFVVEGYAVTPNEMGPLDYYSPIRGVFNDFSQEFDLASSSVILGMAAIYTGDPVITIEHGGEPLTIVRIDKRDQRLLTLIAVGRGLTLETANLTINVTGGSVGGGAFRINEMLNIDPDLSGWEDGMNGEGPAVGPLVMDGVTDGVVKIAMAIAVNDPSNRMTFVGAEKVSGGFLTSGEPIDLDYSSTGEWTLEGGWSWDGDDLVHTGRTQSTASMKYIQPVGERNVSIQAYGTIEEGGGLSVEPTRPSGSSYYPGPYTGGMWCAVSSNPSTGQEREMLLVARGDVRVNSVLLTSNSLLIGWAFGSAPAVDGGEISSSTSYRPQWCISAAEILGEDY